MIHGSHLVLTGQIRNGLPIEVSAICTNLALDNTSEGDLQASILVLPLLVLAIGERPAGLPHVRSFAYGRPKLEYVELRSCSKLLGDLSRFQLELFNAACSTYPLGSYCTPIGPLLLWQLGL